MDAPDDSAIHLFHTVWSALLTLLLAIVGWFMRWNWNRLVAELDRKASLESLGDVRADIERRHKENLDALREIKDAITHNDKEATTVRNSLQQTMQQLVGQVGKIEGFINATRGDSRS